MRTADEGADPIAKVDLVALWRLRQELKGLLDHADARVRLFAAGAGGDLIAQQVDPHAGGGLLQFLLQIEQGVVLLRLALGRERRSATGAITTWASSNPARGCRPESGLLETQVAVLRAKKNLKSGSVVPTTVPHRLMND